MNGATALDCENTISKPNSTKMITIGNSQYFHQCPDAPDQGLLEHHSLRVVKAELDNARLDRGFELVGRTRLGK